MRKLIAIFLIVLLPLQWGWAMAASYCEHEVAAGAAHFGHHEHAHGDHAAPAAGDASHEAASPGDGGHADCGTCQLSSASAVLPGLSLATPTTADTLPVSTSACWLDAHPELLYRPPLPTAV